MIDFIGLGILLFLVVAFGYLFKRALGSQNRILKWAGLVLSGLLTLFFALVFLAAIFGTTKLNANYNTSNPVANITVQGTPEQIARGERLAHTCVGCHSPNDELPMSGQDFGAGFGVPLGTLYARNLTPGGEIKDWSDGEIIRAFREGVHKSGRPLLIMPSDTIHNFSDEDAQAVVAYLRSQPAVTPDAPPNQLNVIGALFAGLLGEQLLSNQPAITQPIVAPPDGATAEYGQYLASITCESCHGKNLKGAPDPAGGPPVPGLTNIPNVWTEAQFIQTIHTGTRPDGSTLGEGMPWKDISAVMTDDNLKAIYAYIKTLK